MPNQVVYTFIASDKFSNVARHISRRTDDLSKKMSEFRTEAAAASGAVNRLVGGIRKKGFGLIATGAVFGAAQIPFLRQFAELEKMQVAFEQIVGSAEKGRAVFKDLQKFQRGTPFDLISIKGAAQTLLTFGSQTEDLRMELTALGNIAAASGGSIEDLAFVFGKAQLAGRVTQEVVNSLAIRGAEVMKVWAKKTGKSVDEIRKAISTGQIPFEALRETILDLGAREGGRFFGIMAEQSKRLGGAWTRLGGATVIFKGKLGGLLSEAGNIPGFLGFLERMVTKLTTVMVDFAKAHPILMKLVARLGTVFIVLGITLVTLSGILQTLAFVALPLIILRFVGLKAVISLLMFALPGLKLAITGLVFLFGALASASFLVLGALVLVPVALFLIIKYFDEIKAFFKSLGKFLKEIFGVIDIWLEKITTVIGKVTGLSKLKSFILGGKDVDLSGLGGGPVDLGSLGGRKVDLSKGGEFLSRNTATVEMTINAAKGVIQSMKSKTTGDKGGFKLGFNMVETP